MIIFFLLTEELMQTSKVLQNLELIVTYAVYKSTYNKTVFWIKISISMFTIIVLYINNQLKPITRY